MVGRRPQHGKPGDRAKRAKTVAPDAADPLSHHGPSRTYRDARLAPCAPVRRDHPLRPDRVRSGCKAAFTVGDGNSICDSDCDTNDQRHTNG